MAARAAAVTRALGTSLTSPSVLKRNVDAERFSLSPTSIADFDDEVDTEICNPSKKHLVLDGPFVARSVVRVDLASQSALRDGEFVFFDLLSPDELACLIIDDRNTVLSCLGRPQSESTSFEILEEDIDLNCATCLGDKIYSATIIGLISTEKTVLSPPFFYLGPPFKGNACFGGIVLSD